MYLPGTPLPSVDELFRTPQGQAADCGYLLMRRPSQCYAPSCRRHAQRSTIGAACPSTDELSGTSQHTLGERLRPRLRPVINATGVVINTNLGRAPLSTQALQAVERVANGYSNLEYDLEAGTRGSRHTHITALLRELTGAEAALVTNNNAAAVLLGLSALAQGHEVIISRGQLVEIGGGFRVPDVMVQSGCQLVEVGTTNRTRITDYATALTERTAILLAVHPSNFLITGFTEATALSELTTLAHQHRSAGHGRSG